MFYKGEYTDRCIELARSGYTVNQIANELGITYHRVYGILQFNGEVGKSKIQKELTGQALVGWKVTFAKEWDAARKILGGRVNEVAEIRRRKAKRGNSGPCEDEKMRDSYGFNYLHDKIYRGDIWRADRRKRRTGIQMP